MDGDERMLREGEAVYGGCSVLSWMKVVLLPRRGP